MTIIIAEAGVNHNGSESLALKLVDAAFHAGADIVKFQTFKAKNLVTKHANQAEYQAINMGKRESQLHMLSKLELSFQTHLNLVSHCNDVGIEFLSTAFDFESLRFLVKELGLKRLKIPSGDITNAPLVLEHARSGCDIILSTGMSTLSEIEAALGVIAFGYISGKNSPPSISAFEDAYTSDEGQAALRNKVSILHCTTEYPAPVQEINLRAIGTLNSAFKLVTGYSDHSSGIAIPIAAVARGALIIEKHFTLDRSMEGPDHKASLEPDELNMMVSAIRQVEQALGDGIKRPTQSESSNKIVARKSLCAACDINKGEKLTPENISILRPGGGESPYYYWHFIGSLASRSYLEGELLDE